ncbi:MAG: tetratricopeptide repeat protein [Proteobacteria bacterium]|nr:tetratricopeptide repeat protein [Pseudomonadota bacterium]
MAPSSTPMPQAFDAAYRDATAAHQAGRFAQAVAGYEALLPMAPEHAQLRYLLGAAYVELSRFTDAVTALEQALRLRPRHLPTVEMMGSAWLRAQAPEKSVAYFREADMLAGSTAETTDRLANALRLAGQYPEASAAYRSLLARDPSQHKAYVGLALCLAASGDAAGAEHILRVCLQRHAGYGSAVLTLASVLGQMERFTEAEQVLRDYLAGDPSNLGARRLLANALHKQGRLVDAEDIYRDILRTNPDETQTSLQLTEALLERSQLDEAELILRELKRAAPGHADVITTLGRALELRGDLDGAIALHSEAIARDPRNANAYLNRGSAKRFSGDFEAALADYDAALALKPHFPPAIANRGLTLLILGRLREAWPSYRARIRAVHGAPDLTSGKPWDGSPLAGKRVLVWLEYGLGDEILFANLLPELIDTTAHCTIVCSPRLCRLFERSFPRARIVAMGSAIDGDFDVRLPLTDAAQLLRPTVASLPRHRGYIVPDSTLVQEMRARYQNGTNARLVGLSWRSAAGPTGRFKSLQLAQFAKFLDVPDLNFVSLQYGDCTDEIAQVSAMTRRSIIHDTRVDSSGDLDAFAAQTAAMDLVISVSNTTVHVAGALGRPVWALVPTGPGAHWYWFMNRTDSPWYPSARLFRQDRRGDWEKPLDDITAELAKWAHP